MRLKGASPIKAGLTALAAAALALGVSMPAYAADVPIGPDDVIGFEDGAEGTAGYNYDQWHIGLSVGDNPAWQGRATSESLDFGACSVTALAHPNAANGSHIQVLKGFEIAQRPTTAATDDTSEFQALIDTTSIVVVEGIVTIQIPIFERDDADSSILDFTTLRSVHLGPGTYSLASLNVSDSDNWLGGEVTVADFLDWTQDGIDLEGVYYEILGVGFTGSEGAEVTSLSFGGNTYLFGTGSCPSANPTPPEAVETAAR